MSDEQVQIGRLDERVKALEAQFASIESKLEAALKRPTWGATVAITTLTTLCASLVVYAVSIAPHAIK